MADNKTVNFQGKDGGINRLMDQYKRKAESMYSGMQKDADKLNLSLEKQVAFMNKQVEQLEKQSRLIKQRLTDQASQDYQQETFQAKTSQQRAQANEGYTTSTNQANVQREGDKQVVGLLREMIKANEDDEFVDEARKNDNNGPAGIIAILKRMEKLQKDGNVGIGKIVALAAIAGGGAGTVAGVLAGQGGGGTGGTGGGGGHGGGGGGHGGGHSQGLAKDSMLKSLIRAEIINNAFNKMAKMGSVSNENQMIGELYGMGTQVGGMAAGKLMSMGSGIPFIGGIFESAGEGSEKMSELMGNLMSSSKTRELEEFEQYEIPMFKLGATTGMHSSGDLSDLGIERSKSVERSLSAAKAQMSKKQLLDRTELVARGELGLGLDNNTMMGLLGTSRMTTGGVKENMSNLYGNMRSQGLMGSDDMLPFHEALQFQMGLMNQKGGSLEMMNTDDFAGATSMMRGVGGGFGDARGGQRMGQIDQALSNPNNDYQKARSFAALSKLKPDASYFELLEMQEKGVAQEGYLGAMLKQLEGEVGGGEELMLGAAAEFGVSKSVSRTLVEKFEKDRNYFDQFGGTTAEAAKKAGYKGEFQGKLDGSEQWVTHMEVSVAKIADSFAESWGKGITTAFTLSGIKLGHELHAAFDKAFKSGAPHNKIY